MVVSENTINNIVNAIVSTGLAHDVLVFGSYARGEQTDDSDIDFCILTDDNLPEGTSLMQLTADLYGKIRNIEKPPIDLLVYRRSDFISRSSCPVTFEHTILQEGKKLYGFEQHSA